MPLKGVYFLNGMHMQINQLVKYIFDRYCDVTFLHHSVDASLILLIDILLILVYRKREWPSLTIN